MQRLAIPGLHMWSAWQPERGMFFNSFLVERPGGNVAIDPLPLDDDGTAYLERAGGITTIVLTNRDHERGAQALRERFGAKMLASHEEARLFSVSIDATFTDGEEVFPGGVAIALRGAKTPGEVALHLPKEKAAIVGDALIGAPAGSLSLLADQKLADPAALVLSLRRLWALELDALLLGDGQPLFAGADGALAVLLETRGGASVNRINLDELTWKHDVAGNGSYESTDAEVGLLIGARKLGYRLTTIPPGKKFCPVHSHMLEEETFFVLDGEPTIRTPRGSLPCRKGDFIAFPVGDRGAHQVVNESAAPATLLLLGLNCDPEVCYYPDSDKIGLFWSGSTARGLMRASPRLDYFDGE